MKFSIPVTHFYLPNGEQIEKDHPVPEAVWDKWLELRGHGLRVTSEVLQNYVTSLAIEDRDNGDFDMELSKTEPRAVFDALCELVLRFDSARYEDFAAEMQS